MDGLIHEPADILIYMQEKGLVLNEKSLIAYDTKTQKILAAGSEAERLAKVDPDNVRILSPLRQGAIDDYMAAEKLFACLLRKALGKKPVIKPKIALCVPAGITVVEKKAVQDALYQAGAGDVILADVPAEQFMSEQQQKDPKLYRQCKIVIGITKDNPESYVKEQLTETLRYAAQQGISAERVAWLFEDSIGKSNEI